MLQDALSEIARMYPPLKLKVFVDDITALLVGKKQGSGRNGKECDEKVLKESLGKGLQNVGHREWKGRKG